MGRKKKPFVDKKRSSSYHLLHRSQRDVADDVAFLGGDGDASAETAPPVLGNGLVLWPSPGNDRDTDRRVLFGDGGAGKGDVVAGGTDPAAGGGGTANKKFDEWRRRLREAGLLDAEAAASEERERYLKPITGAGTFLDSSGRVVSATAASSGSAAASPIDEELLLMEVRRQFESLPLTSDCMDDDVAAALFGGDDDEDGVDGQGFDFDGEFEELDDDFVLQAAREPDLPEAEAEAQGTDAAEPFDFDEHVRRLMEKAKQERSELLLDEEAEEEEKRKNRDFRSDSEFFSRLRPIREKGRVHGDDDDDDEDTNEFEDGESMLRGDTGAGAVVAVSKLDPDEEQALLDKFEETLLEYDSDQIGEGEDDDGVDEYYSDDDIGEGNDGQRGYGRNDGGLRRLDDKIVEAAMDDFLQEKDDEIFLRGTAEQGKNRNKSGGSGYSALPDAIAGMTTADGAAVAPEPLRPSLPPPPEEILIDGQSYFSERFRNPYDCESILTTYSNLDNNPVKIGPSPSRRRRNRNKKDDSSADEEDVVAGIQKIRLSQKTGLPIGVYPTGRGGTNLGDDSNDDQDGTYISVNRGEARSKKETPAEKKARKAAVKKERQIARIQKKVVRDVFREEFEKHQVVDVGGDACAGKTVFRYS